MLKSKKFTSWCYIYRIMIHGSIKSFEGMEHLICFVIAFMGEEERHPIRTARREEIEMAKICLE
jgi:hypothetical protein